MPTIARFARQPAVFALVLTTLAFMTPVAAGQTSSSPPAPPPAVAPAAERSAAEITAELRATVAAELKGARERLAALDAAASAELKTAATKEVEFLERIDLVLGQRASALDRCAELERTRDELQTQLESMRGAGPTEPGPYSLLQLDAVRDELETERGRATAVDAAVEASSAAITEAKRIYDEKERHRRRAGEAHDTNTDEKASAALGRELRFRQLESRLAKRTVELRETEARREALTNEVHVVKLATLEERQGWIQRATRFTRDDLDSKLVEIETRRAQLRQRLDLQEGTASFFETEWFNARRRLDEAAGEDPVLTEEVQARKLAYQARKEEIDAITRQLERLADAVTVWNRRYDVALDRVDRLTLKTWEAEAQGRIDALTTEQKLHTARVADLRSQLASLSPRVEVAENAEVKRWLRTQQDQLRIMSETLEGRLTNLLAAQRLQSRLRVDIGIEAADVTLEERLADWWASIRAVWEFELTSVDERPVTVGKIVIGLFILIFGFFASRIFSRLIGRRVLPRLRLNEGAAAAVQSLIFYVLVITFALFAFRAVNIPLTAFTVLGGALAIGVGFGSQNVISNFISGLILFAERPVRVGDLVQLDALHATVEHIGARSTRVRTGENVEIIVPNSVFLEQNVINWTLSEDRIRISVAVGVAYGSPTRETAKLLKQAVDEHARVLRTPAPIVVFKDFGDNALAFETHFWIRMKRMMDRRMIESDIRFRIDELFHEAGIVIAFPQRDVHLDSLRPVEVRLVSEAKD